MIMAKDSNNNYVNIEDIEAKNNNEYQDIEKIVSKQGNLLYNKYKETEDTLPINFKGKGKDLKNYRIYGNTVDGESVGDRTANLFDMKKFAELCSPRYASVTFADNTLSFTSTAVDAYVNYVFGKGDTVVNKYRPSCIDVLPSTTYTISMSSMPKCYISWINSSFKAVSAYTRMPNNQSSYTFTTPENCTKLLFRFGKEVTKIGDTFTISNVMLNAGSTPLPYEPYGYKVPVTVKGKNLLPNTATSQTINGVTFTVNNDGSITCNGTATALILFKVNAILTLPVGEFILTGAPTGGSWNSSYYLYVQTDNISPQKYYYDIGNGTTINNTSADIVYSTRIVIESGYSINNQTFYPMIRKAGIVDDTYEPYHTPVTTPIYLPEPIKMIGDEAEYIDYAEQKQHRVRKNLLQNTATSQTINGVTFTVNSDGSVTCNGTANNTILYEIHRFPRFSGKCILSGCPINGSQNTYRLQYTNMSNMAYQEYGTGVDIYQFDETQYPTSRINIRIENGYTCDDLTFYPMIRKADITDDTYEPYIENTELDVTLPALPTIKGTNTLSVDTEVQPSSVYLKGKLKRTIYGWHVDPDISDSSNAITYLKDAIGMTPASMGSSTFDYGSWENVFFMPKPCMLKSNGKVDYYLDPNDYTKKLDGTASDISNPNYDGNAMMQWPKIWFKYVKGVKEGQGYFYVANYKADGNFHCWCNYDSEDNEIDHFYTAIYNGTSFMNYNASKTYVLNDFAIYDNKLYKCNTAITTLASFDNTKWDLVSNTAPVINKIRSLSGVRLTNNNGNAQTNTTTEVTRATANNTTSAAEWDIETFSDRLLINGLLVLMGKSLNTQAVFGRGLDTGGQSAKEAYVTGALNNKGLFWGVTGNGNSGVKVFGMENFWGCCWHRTAGLIINNHAVKLKLTYGTKDGSTVIGYNQTGNGYIDNGTAPYSNGYVQKMSYNKYGFMPAEVTGGSKSTYYADYHYQNADYTGTIYALFGGCSGNSLDAGAFCLNLSRTPGIADWHVAASLSCKPISLFN